MCFKNCILIVSLLSAVSCTVLEDRLPCPCVLTLDFSEVNVRALEDEGFVSLVWEIRAEDGSLSTGSEALRELPESEEILFGLEKGSSCEFRIRPVSDGGDLFCGEGTECPAVYFEKKTITAEGEAITDTVRLHKQFANVNLFFKSSSLILNNMELVASCCGFDENLELVRAPYRVPVYPDRTCTDCIRVPRQEGPSMRLDMQIWPDDTRSFALGNYLEASGYDWASEDLEDIYIEIDCIESRIVLYSDIWQRTLSYSVNL